MRRLRVSSRYTARVYEVPRVKARQTAARSANIGDEVFPRWRREGRPPPSH
jgi:hypothetical protein